MSIHTAGTELPASDEAEITQRDDGFRVIHPDEYDPRRSKFPSRTGLSILRSDSKTKRKTQLMLGSDYPWMDSWASYQECLSWVQEFVFLSARDLAYFSHRTFDSQHR